MCVDVYAYVHISIHMCVSIDMCIHAYSYTCLFISTGMYELAYCLSVAGVSITLVVSGH